MPSEPQPFTRHSPGALPSLPPGAAPRGPVAYLDIETTGLCADDAHVTVVGLLDGDGRGRRLRQYFVDRRRHERGVLQSLVVELRRYVGTVTYNGASFDLPFLRRRARFHGIRWPWVETFDLLRLAFSWRAAHGQLPNCRLQTVMAHFGVRRTDATRGEEMVDRYRRWRRTGNERHRDVILEHNAQDLLLLPAIVPALTGRP